MSSGKSGAPQRRPLKPLSFYLHVFFLLRVCIPRLTFRFPRTVLFLHPAVVFAHAYKQFLFSFSYAWRRWRETDVGNRAVSSWKASSVCKEKKNTLRERNGWRTQTDRRERETQRVREKEKERKGERKKRVPLLYPATRGHQPTDTLHPTENSDMQKYTKIKYNRKKIRN